MTRILVTGMSGTGKTTLLEELGRRGHRVVDTDYGDWHEVVDGERLWHEGRIGALLDGVADDSHELLFVQGTVRNQGHFRDRFDHVVLLSAPAEVIIERLATRTDNPYGKNPAELVETLENLELVEPLLRKSATLEVVTTVPVTEVADVVLAHVRRAKMSS
ncbi:AAA family ATPase [Catenulispora sp. NF23]|uniref:AAA family ATPase n=1 Tax=Catenulispora pinistramenti TaxID=2705254 RepID=A0ABS5L7X4_9ACTN|nr:AAA family ATPase [Catenulispora pinistramenti]MBS2539730.1 AAA family ATPase [Catenulispora pinistramenti]MBS2554468.1 AAA family ATPase [Catenulispora pinistramenti]